MSQKIAIAALTIILSLVSQTSSWASEVLERIRETGVINAGVRKDAIPFGFVNEQGEWVGYSLDILELIRQETEKQLGKPITLQKVEVNPENRFTKLKDGTIDLECGSTTITWERKKEVDFSVSYFASGTKLLVKTDSNLNTIESLAGRRIGVIPNTTNEKVIRLQQPAAELIIVQDRYQGLEKLIAGEIDGFASDGIVLHGLRKTAINPSGLEVVPDFPYVYESYACALPENQSQWRDLVNYSLIKFMGGIVTDNLEYVAIYERWFGEDGEVPYSRELINDYFQGIVNTYEWIPLVGE